MQMAQKNQASNAHDTSNVQEFSHQATFFTNE